MGELRDVIILGGGPAGSTAATLLARLGHDVVVLEREKFPRFHIGESLLPYSIDAFERLGLREELDRRFVTKLGGEVATACGSKRLKFYFRNGLKARHTSSYQVLRADFDKLLLDRAVAAGAEVREETAVAGLDLSGEQSIVRTRAADGTTGELRARFLLDASGRQTLVANHLKIKEPYPGLNKLSVFAHFEGVQRDLGEDAGHIRLVRGAHHWFWMIPVSESVTSIGLVMDSDRFKSFHDTPGEVLEKHLSAQPLMAGRMKDAQRVGPVHAQGDYSYRTRRLTGPNWALLGDAGGFIDPIFSTGVFLAIHSADLMAANVDRWLKDRRQGDRAIRRYERRMRRVLRLYLRFVHAWYREEFIEVFTNPVGKIKLTEAVNSVLSGNIGHDFAIWWRMQLFYLVVFAQRFVPLCPRVHQPVVTP